MEIAATATATPSGGAPACARFSGAAFHLEHPVFAGASETASLAGIAVSAGSACSSGSMKPSRVLEAMGIPVETASTVIRVSFGPQTTEPDIERFIATWRSIRERASSRAA
jgi:cysteine desulfurase